ncbi:hypothetical protein [Desulfurobacterium atlanticum]|uniref:hypothetical protein n=1 Tax=Desulfurobacterium atlanticum TaxID=240169 RepID=UPI000B791BC2|nr:hypothetical protein [Desulfurobacterium atlanticum]
MFDILEIKPLPKEFFFKLRKKYPELSAAKLLYEKEKEVEVARICDFLSRIKYTDHLKDKNVSKKNEITNRRVGF